MNECFPQDGVDEITDEETLSLLQLAVHTPEVARNVMYPVFFAVGALLLAAVAIFIYHRFVLFAIGLSIFIFFFKWQIYVTTVNFALLLKIRYRNLTY